MDEKKIKEVTDRLENVMGEAMKKVAPQLEGMAKELQKIVRPKSKKNIKFNGSNIAISLIEDGRIMITCSTLDEAQSIYDSNFENNNIGLFIAEKDAWKKRAIENESKWWYKFFNYFSK